MLLCFGGAMLVLLTRFGLLSVVSASCASSILFAFPLTVNLSAWYAGYGVLPLLFVLGAAIWAFQHGPRGTTPLPEKPSRNSNEWGMLSEEGSQLAATASGAGFRRFGQIAQTAY
jgi:hypothetical protein